MALNRLGQALYWPYPGIEGGPMDTAVSENSFRRGLEAVQRRAFLEALAYFEAALKLAKRQGSEAVPMKDLSYYGLCGGVGSSRLGEARRSCGGAGREGFYKPHLERELGGG